MLDKDKIKIGFIGTGIMGKSMAKNLMRAGFRLNVYNRTAQSAAELIDMGAAWKDTVAELAADSDVVITIVGYPSDVEQVYLGENGAIAHAKPGSYLIDMTTSSPLLAKKIYQEAKSKGLYALDAPVSGGDVGAREAKLSIMVGGDEEAFNQVKPILEAMGTDIVLHGEAGAGQYTKMCNQINVAGNMLGVCEAMAYAVKAGLNPERVIQSISGGAAASRLLTTYAPRMIKEDFAPGFYIKHFIKDMKIAIESAEELGLKLPGLELAKSLYEQLAAQGEENSGIQALFKYYNLNFSKNNS